MDLSADSPKFLAQLESILAEEPPPANIRTIHFGLFERASDQEEGASIPTLYVCGYLTSGEDDDPDWEPAHRYFSLDNLASADSSEWEAILTAMGNMLRANAPRITSLVGTMDGRAVTVAWDDGDSPKALFIAQR